MAETRDRRSAAGIDITSPVGVDQFHAAAGDCARTGRFNASAFVCLHGFKLPLFFWCGGAIRLAAHAHARGDRRGIVRAARGMAD